MSPRSLSTSMPSTACTWASRGAAPSPSPALPERISTPSTSSVPSSVMTSILYPAKLREADLRPWRILRVGGGDDPVLGHPLADLRVAFFVVLGVLGHHLGKHAGGLGKPRVVNGGGLGNQHPGCGHQLTQMLLAGLGVLPVDVGLCPQEPNGGRRRCLAQAAGGGLDRLAQEPPDELVGVADRSGSVHGGRSRRWR